MADSSSSSSWHHRACVECSLPFTRKSHPLRCCCCRAAFHITCETGFSQKSSQCKSCEQFNDKPVTKCSDWLLLTTLQRGFKIAVLCGTKEDGKPYRSSEILHALDSRRLVTRGGRVLSLVGGMGRNFQVFTKSSPLDACVPPLPVAEGGLCSEIIDFFSDGFPVPGWRILTRWESGCPLPEGIGQSHDDAGMVRRLSLNIHHVENNETPRMVTRSRRLPSLPSSFPSSKRSSFASAISDEIPPTVLKKHPTKKRMRNDKELSPSLLPRPVLPSLRPPVPPPITKLSKTDGPLRARQVHAFLLSENFKPTDVAGNFLERLEPSSSRVKFNPSIDLTDEKSSTKKNAIEDDDKVITGSACWGVRDLLPTGIPGTGYLRKQAAWINGCRSRRLRALKAPKTEADISLSLIASQFEEYIDEIEQIDRNRKIEMVRENTMDGSDSEAEIWLSEHQDDVVI